MTPREYLYSLELHGIKLGLENIRALLAALGNPEESFPAVHVAGTNGKGSVLAFLDAMFAAAGYRTGRFTSPHLIRLNERFLIDRVPVADDVVDDAIAACRAHAEAMSSTPTFFEVNTAVAYQLFSDAEIDCGLIETGLGGRFDSTNTLSPVATAITSIGLEHTQYLGDTLEAIAFEKAGILKPGVPAVVGPMEAGPLEVIEQRAREVGSPLYRFGREYAVAPEVQEEPRSISVSVPGADDVVATIGLPGRYQRANAAIAIVLAKLLRQRFPKLNDDVIAYGLSDARWPCRLERVLDDPEVVVDIAHNMAGAEVLARDMKPDSVCVVAVSSDKNAREMLNALRPNVRRFILTAFENRRALSVNDLSACAKGLPFETSPTIPEALNRAFAVSADEGLPIYVTGSIFAAGEARDWLERERGAPPMRF